MKKSATVSDFFMEAFFFFKNISVLFCKREKQQHCQVSKMYARIRKYIIYTHVLQHNLRVKLFKKKRVNTETKFMNIFQSRAILVFVLNLVTLIIRMISWMFHATGN